jgi:hypothetical protein
VISVESSNECKCMMRMIHLVQDKSPVEVASEYSNSYKRWEISVLAQQWLLFQGPFFWSLCNARVK